MLLQKFHQSALEEGEVSASVILMLGGIAPHLLTVRLSGHIDMVEGWTGIDIQTIEVIVSDLHLGDIGPLPGIGLEEAEAFQGALLATVAEQKVGTAAALFAATHPHQRGSDLMVASVMALDPRSRD